MLTLTEKLLSMTGGEATVNPDTYAGMDAGFTVETLSAIGVYGKVLTRDGDMTSEFIARCHAGAHEALRLRANDSAGVMVIVSGWASGQINARQPELIDTEGWKGAQCVREEIRRIGGDVWPVYADEDVVDRLAGGENIFPCIVAEPRARMTDENAEFIARILTRIRSQIATVRGISEDDAVPVKLGIATSPYHFERETVRLTSIPERAGLMSLRRNLSGVDLFPVSVPYPPLTSSNPATSWRARLYVAAHLLPDALLANLYWLGEDERTLSGKRLSRSGVERAVTAIRVFEELFNELAPFDEEKRKTYGDEVADLRTALAAQLEPLKRLMRDLLTRVGEILEGRDSPASIPAVQWKSWAVTLSGLIGKPIRWAADPDRR
ncbi:hypothetical protein GC176_25445 [bacterium]|nr:hypothetical protein [bacterium]